MKLLYLDCFAGISGDMFLGTLPDLDVRESVVHIWGAMTKATITQAKTRLNALIDAALRGERVVITRGSKPAAAIVPVDANGSPTLHVSDEAADYLAHEARIELDAGTAKVYESPAKFATALTKPRRRA